MKALNLHLSCVILPRACSFSYSRIDVHSFGSSLEHASLQVDSISGGGSHQVWFRSSLTAAKRWAHDHTYDLNSRLRGLRSEYQMKEIQGGG